MSQKYAETTTLPEQPRYALRSQPVKVIEHLNAELELLWGAETLPFKTFERHQHLSVSRVADDKLLNGRVDAVLQKESLRLRKLQALVAAQNAKSRSRSPQVVI